MAPVTDELPGLVLAAGRSRRFPPGNKLLTEVRGQAVIARTLEAYSGALATTFVVTDGRDEAMRRLLSSLPVRIVHNPNPELGLSASLRAGLAALPASSAGAVIGVGDQPLLTAAIIRLLVHQWELNPTDIITPHFRGEPGNPSVYPRSLFGELMKVEGDVGGRSVRDRRGSRAVHVDEWWMGLDLDTTADLRAIEKHLGIAARGSPDGDRGPRRY